MRNYIFDNKCTIPACINSYSFSISCSTQLHYTHFGTLYSHFILIEWYKTWRRSLETNGWCKGQHCLLGVEKCREEANPRHGNPKNGRNIHDVRWGPCAFEKPHPPPFVVALPRHQQVMIHHGGPHHWITTPHRKVNYIFLFWFIWRLVNGCFLQVIGGIIIVRCK